MKDYFNVEDVIKKDQSSFLFTKPKEIINIHPDNYPESIDRLVIEILQVDPKEYTNQEDKIRKYGKGKYSEFYIKNLRDEEIKSLKFITYYTLKMVGFEPRETGRIDMEHYIRIARDLFLTGEQALLLSGEKWHHIGAAISHDLTENRVHRIMKHIRKKDNTANKKWYELDLSKKSEYIKISGEKRIELICDFVSLLRKFNEKYCNNNKNLDSDITVFGAIHELISKPEYVDYMQYCTKMTNPLLRDQEQVEVLTKIGFFKQQYLVLGFSEQDNEEIVRFKNALENNDMVEAANIWKDAQIEIIKNMPLVSDYNRDTIIIPTMRIKLLDGIDNITDVFSKEEGYQSYSFAQQNYIIYKHQIFNTAMKGLLKSTGRLLRKEFDRMPEYIHLKKSMKASMRQADMIVKEIRSKNPWYFLNYLIYTGSVRLYDQHFGFEGKTMFGETQFPRRVFGPIKATARLFDGTMGRYAGRIHRLYTEKDIEDVGPMKNLRDAVALRYFGRLLLDRKAFVPYIAFTLREAQRFKIAGQKKKGNGIFTKMFM